MPDITLPVPPPGFFTHALVLGRRSSPVFLLLCCLMALALAAPAFAQLTYDANTGSSGAQDGAGSGWDTTTLNWWNSSIPGNVVWPNNSTSTAIFGAGSGTAGTVTVGTVTANGITFAAAGSGTYTLSSGTITLAGTTPTITANVNASIGSTLQGTNGLTKAGAGTLTLSVANTYTGGTTISAGTLAITNASALSTGTVTLNGGTLLLNGVDMSNAITFNSTTNTISAVGNYRTLSGKISGTGGFSFSGGSSTPGITLTNSGNDFQGDITVGSGNFLRLGASNVLPDTATVNLTGNLRVNGGLSDSVAGLSGSGNVFATTGSAASTLRVGAGDKSSTFSGAISSASNTGAINVEKIGTGTFTLSAVNTFDPGTTTVTSGTLALTSAGTTTAGAVAVKTGGTLLGTGTVRGSSFTAESGSTVHAGNGTTQTDYGTLNFTPVSGSGSYDFQSGSTVVLGINPGGTGDLLNVDGLSAGTLTFNGNLQVTAAAGFTPASAQTFNLLDWANLSTVTFASRYSAASYSGYLLGNGDDNQGFDLPDISGSGYAWDISHFTSDGTISTVSIVPEPARMLLMFGGLLGACLRRSRRLLNQHSQNHGQISTHT